MLVVLHADRHREMVPFPCIWGPVGVSDLSRLQNNLPGSLPSHVRWWGLFLTCGVSTLPSSSTAPADDVMRLLIHFVSECPDYFAGGPRHGGWAGQTAEKVLADFTAVREQLYRGSSRTSFSYFHIFRPCLINLRCLSPYKSSVFAFNLCARLRNFVRFL